MGTSYDDEMVAFFRQKEMLQAAEQACLARIALRGENKRSTLLELAIVKFKLGIATLSTRAVRSARVSSKLPLENRA